MDGWNDDCYSLIVSCLLLLVIGNKLICMDGWNDDYYSLIFSCLLLLVIGNKLICMGGWNGQEMEKSQLGLLQRAKWNEKSILPFKKGLIGSSLFHCSMDGLYYKY
jgi:hypothetical protein